MRQFSFPLPLNLAFLSALKAVASSLNSIIAQKIKVIPLEVVLRNTAFGSLCKETTIKPRTVLENPLIDLYLKNDLLNDPLLTRDRIKLLDIIDIKDLDFIIDLTLKINTILKNFFNKIDLDLVDFKLEFGYNSKNEIILCDEISPDNCRLWDVNQKNDMIVSLDKDRFRNDTGSILEPYTYVLEQLKLIL